MSPSELEPRSAPSTSSSVSLSHTHRVKTPDSDYHLMFPVVSDCRHPFLLQEMRLIFLVWINNHPLKPARVNKYTKTWWEVSLYMNILKHFLFFLLPASSLTKPAINRGGGSPKQTGPAQGFFLPLLLVWGSGPRFLQMKPILIVKGAILIKKYLNWIEWRCFTLC